MDGQEELFSFLKEEGVSVELLDQVRKLLVEEPTDQEWEYRISKQIGRAHV